MMVCQKVLLRNILRILSMLNEKSQNPGVVSIKKICDGIDISIREFFDNDLFDELEQEIK